MNIFIKIKKFFGTSLFYGMIISILGQTEAGLREDEVEWKQVHRFSYEPRVEPGKSAMSSGDMGEDFADQFFEGAGLTRIWPQGNITQAIGCDHIYYDPTTKSIIINESKYRANCPDDPASSLELSSSSLKGQQLSRKWIRESIKAHLKRIARSAHASGSSPMLLEDLFDEEGQLKDRTHTLIRTANVSTQQYETNISYLYVVFDSDKNCSEIQNTTLDPELFINPTNRKPAASSEYLQAHQKLDGIEYIKELGLLFREKRHSQDIAVQEELKTLLECQRVGNKEAETEINVRKKEMQTLERIEILETELAFLKTQLRNQRPQRGTQDSRVSGQKHDRDEQAGPSEPPLKRARLKAQERLEELIERLIPQVSYAPEFEGQIKNAIIKVKEDKGERQELMEHLESLFMGSMDPCKKPYLIEKFSMMSLKQRKNLFEKIQLFIAGASDDYKAKIVEFAVRLQDPIYIEKLEFLFTKDMEEDFKIKIIEKCLEGLSNIGQQASRGSTKNPDKRIADQSKAFVESLTRSQASGISHRNAYQQVAAVDKAMKEWIKQNCPNTVFALNVDRDEY